MCQLFFSFRLFLLFRVNPPLDTPAVAVLTADGAPHATRRASVVSTPHHSTPHHTADRLRYANQATLLKASLRPHTPLTGLKEALRYTADRLRYANQATLLEDGHSSAFFLQQHL
jgi:hypothetical protein